MENKLLPIVLSFSLALSTNVLGINKSYSEASGRKQMIMEEIETPKYKKNQEFTIGTGRRKASYRVETGSVPQVVYLGPVNKNLTKVVIPNIVEFTGVSYKVVAIHEKAFKNNKKLKQVTISDTIQEIPYGTFQNCKNLQKVILGKEITRIQKKAFYGCRKLQNIVIYSKNLKEKQIGEKAFLGIGRKAVFQVPKEKLGSYRRIFQKKGVGKQVKFQEISTTSQQKEQEVLKKKEYSNLTEAVIQQEFAKVMENAGISQERQQVFFDHVKQFNGIVKETDLTKGFEVADINDVKYDPYELQEKWNNAYPDFLGYNCRITAFSLFGDFIEIPTHTKIWDDIVLLDKVALEGDGTALLRENDWKRFLTLYSTVKTEDSQEVSTHVKNWKQDWKKRGIAFDTNTNASLITVIFHDKVGKQDCLFIGHVGVLFSVAKDCYYFVEKIAFQEPYQLTKFQSRRELNDYLMTKYDVSYGQEYAAPFIMENDALLAGYRRLPQEKQ